MQPEGRLHRVQVGAFSSRQNADARVGTLREAGFSPYIVQDRGLFKVRVGAFRNRASAVELAERLRAKGFDAILVP
ncbi:MAG: SPOR domain-containing protein [bacterium]